MKPEQISNLIDSIIIGLLILCGLIVIVGTLTAEL